MDHTLRATIPEPVPWETETESGFRNLPLDTAWRPETPASWFFFHSWSCFPRSPFKTESRNAFPAAGMVSRSSAELLDVDGSTKPGAGIGSCSAPCQPLLPPEQPNSLGLRIGDEPGALPATRPRIRGTNRTGAARKSRGIAALGSLLLPKLLESCAVAFGGWE